MVGCLSCLVFSQELVETEDPVGVRRRPARERLVDESLGRLQRALLSLFVLQLGETSEATQPPDGNSGAEKVTFSLVSSAVEGASRVYGYRVEALYDQTYHVRKKEAETKPSSRMRDSSLESPRGPRGCRRFVFVGFFCLQVLNSMAFSKGSVASGVSVGEDGDKREKLLQRRQRQQQMRLAQLGQGGEGTLADLSEITESSIEAGCVVDPFFVSVLLLFLGYEKRPSYLFLFRRRRVSLSG